MVANLDRFYAARDRIEAQIALLDALDRASKRITNGNGPFYDAPALDPVVREDHDLRKPGRLWLLADGYWIGFRDDTSPPTIIACFHESSTGIGPVSRATRRGRVED